MTVLFLAQGASLVKEPRGYARALQKQNICVVFANSAVPSNGDLRAVIDQCSERPSLILHPETDFLPWGLHAVDIPTACFQVDTFAYTRRRIRWSMLFDYVILFHPGFEPSFRRAGHSRVITLPHAVEEDLFLNGSEERTFEVGWVGNLDGPVYASRRRILPMLAARFRMNEWWRPHPYEEMAGVFRRAKVVVNISRDDYPSDANLRVFEAMASGALLLTRLPNELSDIGVRPGEHFVGYTREDEIGDRVAYYLSREQERNRIAQAGREVVLRHHTYDRRVEGLISLVQGDDGQLFAPARKFREGEVRLLYLDYYAAHQGVDFACREWLRLGRKNPRSALRGLPIIARSSARLCWARLTASGSHRSREAEKDQG